MQTFVLDTNVVGEIEATIFTMFQTGPVSALLTLRNVGANTLNYALSEHDGSAWTVLGDSGTDFQTTLTAGQVKAFKVESTYPKVQLQAYASGGAELEFSATRFYTRTAGGSIPILNL